MPEEAAGPDLLQELAKYLPAIVFRVIVKPDGALQLDFVCDEAKELLGFDPKELENEPGQLMDLVLPADREEIQRRMRQCQAEQRKVRHEFRILRRDGVERWLRIEARPRIQADSEGCEWFGVAQDVTEAVERERELKRNKELLDGIFTSIDDAILVIGPPHRSVVKVANAAVERVFGFRPAELQGGTTEILHESRASFEAFGRLTEKVLNRKRSFRGEYRMRRRSGEIFPTEHVIAVLNPQSGWEGGVVSVVRDISEQKHSEEAFRQQDLFIQTVLDRLPIGLALNRVGEGTAIYMNRKFEEIYGWPKEELTDLNAFFEKIYPEPVQREAMMSRILADIASGDPKRMNWENVEITTSTGEQKVVSAMNIPLFEQNIMVSTVQDVTERRRYERKLEESESRYRSLVENTLDGYFICEMDTGKFLFLNQRICELFQYSFQEGLSLTLWDVMDPCEHPVIRKRMRSRIEQAVRSFSSNVYRARRKDGSTFRAEISSSLVTYQGRPVLQGILRDVTEEEKIQDQLQQAQKREAIGTLAGGIAHDFNNILSAIIGYTELAKHEFPDRSEGDAHLGHVLEASQRAKDLVAQILAFSRQGEQEEKPFRVDLILKEALQMIRSSLPSSIEISQSIEKAMPAITGNPTQIYQVVMNLCTNAAQAIEDEHGEIEVSLELVHVTGGDALPTVGLEPGDYLLLKIRDTGRGIPPEVRERVFDPYFTTKNAGEGTGLGLAVVYGIVKKHGGEISVESEVGQGTTFSIHLPVAEGVLQRVAGEKANRTPLPRGKERILFVDDEAAIVKIAQQYLEALGYDVTTRHASIEALQLFRNDPDRFDLVITDMTMPGLTGDDLAIQLLSLCPDLPIILCTGHSNRISESRARRLGIRAFVMKPLTQRELAETVRRALDEKK